MRWNCCRFGAKGSYIVMPRNNAHGSWLTDMSLPYILLFKGTKVISIPWFCLVRYIYYYYFWIAECYYLLLTRSILCRYFTPTASYSYSSSSPSQKNILVLPSARRHTIFLNSPNLQRKATENPSLIIINNIIYNVDPSAWNAEFFFIWTQKHCECDRTTRWKKDIKPILPCILTVRNNNLVWTFHESALFANCEHEYTNNLFISIIILSFKTLLSY